MPRPVIAIDFETYYDKDYTLQGQKAMPVYQYVQDPRFDAYWVALDAEDLKYSGPVDKAPWDKIAGRDAIAHNASFDAMVYRRLVELGKIAAHDQPRSWSCTADMVSYFRVKRSLDYASEHLLGLTIQKETRDRMKGKTLKQAISDGMWDELVQYGGSDARVCRELWNNMYLMWPEKEQRIARMNRTAGFRGVRIDTDKMNHGINMLKSILHTQERNIPWEWDPDKTPLSPEKARQACRDANIWAPMSFAQDDEECKRWEDQYAEQYPWIKALRNWRRINIILKKLVVLSKNLDANGRYIYGLKYFGGATGRFSGSEKFNIQNLPNVSLFGVNLRHLFLPDEGEDFVLVDYRQIEPRFLFWLARDEKMLSLMQQGMSIYDAYARQAMGWTGKDLKTEDPHMYKLAKISVLLCGYQGGGPKLVHAAQRPPYNTILTPAEGDAIVADYRAKNPGVVRFWGLMKQNVTFAALDGNEDFVVTLPSGRDMCYYHLEQRPEGLFAWFPLGDRARKLYGGILTENIDQACCRDILCEGWMRLEDAGYKTLWTTHDDYAISVPNGLKELPAIQQHLDRTPDWAPGLPIATEGKVCKHYE